MNDGIKFKWVNLWGIICTWALLRVLSSAGILFHAFLLHISSRAHVLNLCYKFLISVINMYRLFKLHDLSLFSVFPQNGPVDHEILLSIHPLSNLQNLPSSIFSNYLWNAPSIILNLSLSSFIVHFFLSVCLSVCLCLSVLLFSRWHLLSSCPAGVSLISPAGAESGIKL